MLEYKSTTCGIGEVLVFTPLPLLPSGTRVVTTAAAATVTTAANAQYSCYHPLIATSTHLNKPGMWN